MVGGTFFHTRVRHAAGCRAARSQGETQRVSIASAYANEIAREFFTNSMALALAVTNRYGSLALPPGKLRQS